MMSEWNDRSILELTGTGSLFHNGTIRTGPDSSPYQTGSEWP